MIKILQTRSDIAMAQQRLKDAFESNNSQVLPATLGYQPGTFSTEVLWLPSLGIWAYFGLPPHEKSKGKRYWNVFGEGRPKRVVNITCEINPPLEGINRRAAGAFGLTDDSRTVLLHRGRINVTHGIDKETFREHFRGQWVMVDDDGAMTSMVMVADLSSPGPAKNVRDFVVEVGRIKRLVRQ